MVCLSCSGQLDTPLHTTTLLSMLKMAQQMAEAEAQLQDCEQQLQSQSPAKACTPQQELDSQPQQAQSATDMAGLLHGACMAAGVLSPPGVALLQLCRQQYGSTWDWDDPSVDGVQSSVQGLWIKDSRTTELFKSWFPLLLDAAQQQSIEAMNVVGSLRGKVGVVLAGFVTSLHAKNWLLPGSIGTCQQFKHRPAVYSICIWLFCWFMVDKLGVSLSHGQHEW